MGLSGVLALQVFVSPVGEPLFSTGAVGAFHLALESVFRAAAADSPRAPVDLSAVAEKLYDAYYAKLSQHTNNRLASALPVFPRGAAVIPAHADVGCARGLGHILMENTVPLDIYQGRPPALHSTLVLTVALLPPHRRGAPWPPI